MNTIKTNNEYKTLYQDRVHRLDNTDTTICAGKHLAACLQHSGPLDIMFIEASKHDITGWPVHPVIELKGYRYIISSISLGCLSMPYVIKSGIDYKSYLESYDIQCTNDYWKFKDNYTIKTLCATLTGNILYLKEYDTKENICVDREISINELPTDKSEYYNKMQTYTHNKVLYYYKDKFNEADEYSNEPIEFIHIHR